MPKLRGPGPRRAPARRAPRDAGGWIAGGLLALVLLATALLVDPRADSSFDAPKRLVALAGAALATAAAFVWPRRGRPSEDVAARAGETVSGKTALGAAAVALALIFFSTLLSPRRGVSLEACRALLLMSLFVPLGASRVLAQSRSLLVGTFLSAASVDAAVSILQARGLYRPFEIRTVGAREATGAFVGNVGYLALLLCFAAVAALALALAARRGTTRWLAGVALLLAAGGLVVNQNLTAITALAAGAAALFVLALRRRAVVPIGLAIALLAAGVAAYRPLRERAGATWAAVRSGDWDRTLSYRFGPWAAALEMARERPLLGFGPGTFGAEFVPHRLRAEIRARRRFVNPLLTSSYAETHCDYLQPFAEFGVPAGLALLLAAGALLSGITAKAWKTRGGDRAEVLLLAGLLTAGATAALTWFPFQRPVTAVPLLLAAGRAWRVMGEPLAQAVGDGQ